jgi:hypothetical protein
MDKLLGRAVREPPLHFNWFRPLEEFQRASIVNTNTIGAAVLLCFWSGGAIYVL